MNEEIQRLRDELECDQGADSFATWIERDLRAVALYQSHGAVAFAAKRGVYRPDDQWFDLDAVPEDCPWQLETRKPIQVIDTVFAPIADEVPSFVRAMKEVCRIVVAHLNAEGRWTLDYCLEATRDRAMWRMDPEGSNPVTYMMGGPPNANPTLSPAAVAAGWSNVPTQLARWSAVHDGFGNSQTDWGVCTILPVHRVEPLNETKPEWLDLYCDGSGDRVILLRDKAEDSLVVEWDHETDELGDPMPFFEHIDRDWALEILNLDEYDFPQGPFED